MASGACPGALRGPLPPRQGPPLGTSILGTRWACAAMRRPEPGGQGVQEQGCECTPLLPSSDAYSTGLRAPRAGSLSKLWALLVLS